MLDNHIPGRTTGSIVLASLEDVTLHLDGDMVGDLMGKVVEFSNPDYDGRFVFDHGPYMSRASEYLDGFSRAQRGQVGDIVLHHYFYLEWYSEANGRCVIELPIESCRVSNSPER